jgi:glutaredoxin 3
MAKITIYTSAFCGYCWRAKALLKAKGLEYQEFDVIANPSRRDEMIERAHGRSTVPQIFIDGRHVGGSEDLDRLDQTGELDRLLQPG